VGAKSKDCSIFVTQKEKEMNTRIFSEVELNEVLNSETKMPIEFWNKMRAKMSELDNSTLRQFLPMINPVVKYMAKDILHERGAIRI
jgi:hypothetical protein